MTDNNGPFSSTTPTFNIQKFLSLFHSSPLLIPPGCKVLLEIIPKSYDTTAGIPGRGRVVARAIDK